MSLQHFGAEAGSTYTGKGNPPGFESFTTCKARNCIRLAVPGSHFCAAHGEKKSAPPIFEIPKRLN